jgi:hypothetical protein
VAGVRFRFDKVESWELLCDWRAIGWLNALKAEPDQDHALTCDVSEMKSDLDKAKNLMWKNLGTLGLPFLKPAIRPVLYIKGRN